MADYSGIARRLMRPEEPDVAGTPFEPSFMDKAKGAVDYAYGRDNRANNAAFASVPGAGGTIEPPLGQWLNKNPTIKGAAKQAFDMSMFLGPGAKTANLPALTRAQTMHASGSPREAIWNETGWFQGPDKKWRFEIDDSKASVSPFKTEDKLPTHLQHDALFDAYPSMRDIELYPSPKGAAYGRGDEPSGLPPSIRTTGDKSLTLHEAQHGVQDLEGFATGGDAVFAAFPSNGKGGAWPVYRERLKAMTTPKPIADYAREAGFTSPEEAASSYKDYIASVNKMKRQGLPPHLERILQQEAGRDFYRRLSGEVESRAVQKRMDLTPEQRAARPPWLDYDVPEALQIVK